MPTLHSVEYVTQDGDHIPASEYREQGRQPEEAAGIALSFDCPICSEKQTVQTPTPLSENETHICTGTCEELYYLYPTTTLESGESTVTMTLEELIETQLLSIEQYHQVDRYVGQVGIEMLAELKVAVLGTVGVLLAFGATTLLGLEANLNTLGPNTIAFFLLTAAVGFGGAAVVTGAIAPVVRGYMAYREIQNRVDYSFDKFMRYAANYHHRDPY